MPARLDIGIFAARLKEARLEYGKRNGQPGLSARQFARILGIAAQRYRRYERAELEPPLEVLALLRQVTGVCLDRLISGLPPGDLMVTLHGLRPEGVIILADRLRMMREIANHTVEAVAQLLEIDPADWARWEADLEPPPIEKLIEFGARFSVTVDFLQNGALGGLLPEIRAALLKRYPQLA